MLLIIVGRNRARSGNPLSKQTFVRLRYLELNNARLRMSVCCTCVSPSYSNESGLGATCCMVPAGQYQCKDMDADYSMH